MTLKEYLKIKIESVELSHLEYRDDVSFGKSQAYRDIMEWLERDQNTYKTFEQARLEQAFLRVSSELINKADAIHGDASKIVYIQLSEALKSIASELSK